jgi:hypothetical protein
MSSDVNLIVAGCLRRLLKNRFILKNRTEQWFRHIVDQKKHLEEFIFSMGAKLIIDEHLGIIYLQKLDDEWEEKLSYQLGIKITLNKLSTMVMLVMRKRRADYMENPDASGKCFMTRQEIKEIIIPFTEKIERYKEDKKLENDLKECLRDLKDLQVLFETYESSETYEISAVCDVLLPLEDIQKLELSIQTYFREVTTAGLEE